MNRLENSRDLDRLIEAMADKKVVMLGEASHGTHEYYTWRTEISKRLIEEHGFRFIAVEGDWPDCYKINRFVKAYPDSPAEIREVLETFDRWPTWMWANWEVAALGSWLREHNDGHDDDKKVGFYGLDVYSLWDSMEAMMDYLEKEDPEVLKYVQQAWRCFDPFGQDEQQYARHTLYNNRCRDEVVNLLKQVRERIHSDGDGDPEAALNTEQNAVIAVNAEEYYTAMTRFDNESWNIRDRHMMDTLNRLMKFHGPDAKGIVWEHNTHIGDARATDMEREGMVNIGQLAREEYGRSNVFLCGFGSYSGTVVAADRWGDPTRIMELPEAREGSIEQLLHEQYAYDLYSVFAEDNHALFQQIVPHRAVGVVYNPAVEKYGNYVPSDMAERYDGFIYLDETQALHPLELHTDTDKLAETYPFGY